MQNRGQKRKTAAAAVHRFALLVLPLSRVADRSVVISPLNITAAFNAALAGCARVGERRKSANVREWLAQTGFEVCGIENFVRNRVHGLGK
jgi:hypothetical protein